MKSLEKELFLLDSRILWKEHEDRAEYDRLEITLKRDPKVGLGIAVACYLHKNDTIAGLFVRNLLSGSVSAIDGRVRRHDRIIKVNDDDVEGVNSCKEVANYLTEGGEIVSLTLIRYDQESTEYRYLEMMASKDSGSWKVEENALESSAMAINSDQSPNTIDDDEIIKRKWQSIVGDDYDLVVARIDRSVQQDGNIRHHQHFGITLEGTVDVVNGTESRPHHYIRSVSPDSAAAASGNLRAGDELLEANGYQLYGRSYLQVLDILKQLSSTDIKLICGRPKVSVYSAYFYQPSATSVEFEDVDKLRRNVQLAPFMVSPWMVKAKSETSLKPSGIACPSCSCDSFRGGSLRTAETRAIRSRSLEPLTNLAVWSAQILHVELVKADRGLGFSVVDYQDPLHPSGVVIVVRSLVPGGVASIDGRIVPGDRLVYVDDLDLTVKATLEKAVDALKCTPKGVVRLGIAKPIPLDQNMENPMMTQTERLLAKGSASSPMSHRKWKERGRNRWRNCDGIRYYQRGDRSADVYQEPLSRLLPADFSLEARHRLYPESYVSMSSWSGGSSPSLSPLASPSLIRSGWTGDVIQLPFQLEQTIKIRKTGTDPLGLTVEAIDKAINGCLVKSMLRSGAFGKDGRVAVGDFLLRMNNENLRNVTNSQARAVLKRTNLLGETDFNVSYIPSIEAEKYREQAAKQMPQESTIPNVNRLSPKIFPKFYRSPYVPRRQGAQSIGESDLSSDADMSCRSTEIPVSPKSSSHFGAGNQQAVCAVVESELSTHPHQNHDPVSAASSTGVFSTGSINSIDYAHYPVSGDQYLQSYYEKRATDIEQQQQPVVSRLVEKCEMKIAGNKVMDGFLGDGRESRTGRPSTIMEEGKEEDGVRQETETFSNLTKLASPTPSVASSSDSQSKYWSEARTVELNREPGRSLGISIVGGRVEVCKGTPGTGTAVSGIFVKSVIAQSSAGRCGQLTMGDRILSVNGVDLKEATHEQAVEVVRNAANPVRFVVQSLHSVQVQVPGSSGPGSPIPKYSMTSQSSVGWTECQLQNSTDNKMNGQHVEKETSAIEKEEQEFELPVECNQEKMASDASPDSIPVAEVAESVETKTVELCVVPEEPTEEDVEKLERLDNFPMEQQLSAPVQHSTLNRRPSEPVRQAPASGAFQNRDRRYSSVDHGPSGKTSFGHRMAGYSSVDFDGAHTAGKVDLTSAAMLRKSDDDSEPEDEFGYTEKKMQSKYGDLKGELIMVEVEKGMNGLGLTLAGHRDRSKLSVFVVGIQPESQIVRNGKIVVGDELLEINGTVLHGRSHLNASAIIKGVRDANVKLIILRRPDAIDDMAVNPIQYNPSMQRWLSYSAASGTPMKTALSDTDAVGKTHKQSLAGLPAASKTSVTAAMSVDLSSVPNDKKKENAERTVSTSGLPAERQSTAIGSSGPDLFSLPSVFAPRQVKLQKGPAGFGVTLTEGTTSDNLRGIFVTHISSDSPCAQEKLLKIGDQVMAVNGTSVTDLTSTKVAQLIQGSDEVELTVNSHTIIPLPRSPGLNAKKLSHLGVTEAAPLQRKLSGTITLNLSSNPIDAGYETPIEIDKSGKGLGLSIVGGTDTVLGSVVIHEVYPDGAAAQDGRLEPGDQLLEVNGHSLREVAHETALAHLRQTPNKVRLLVYRDPNLQLSLLDPTQIYNIFEVELMKKPGKGLGLSIVGRKTEPGVFISEVVKGGVADADGRLMQGDQILAVNGQDLTNAMQEQAATILKTCMGKVGLKVGRWKLTTGNNPNPAFPVSQILAPSGAMSPTVPAISVHRTNSALVTIEEPPNGNEKRVVSMPSSPSPSPGPCQQPLEGQASIASSGSANLINGEHNGTILSPTTANDPAIMRTRAPTTGSRGRSSPGPLTLRKEGMEGDAASTTIVAVTPTGSMSPQGSPNPSSSEEVKSSVQVLDLCEEGCDTILVEMQKVPDRPFGMGIGKRPRGILVTSVQSGSTAAEKLRVGDRILAINGQVVTDQQSAVNFVKSGGPRLVLQLARPRSDCMDLATGQMRITKQITLHRNAYDTKFGFDIKSGSLRNGLKASHIYVCSIVNNSPASEDGRIRIGDLLLAVNTRSVKNATLMEAARLIEQSGLKVKLTLMSNYSKNKW